MFNAEQGARLGVEHLLSLGHQRIALLSGPESSVSARARLAAWKAALAEAGLEAAVAFGDWSAACGYEKGMRCCLLQRYRMPFWWLTIKWRWG